MSYPIYKQQIYPGQFAILGRVIHVDVQRGEPHVWYVSDGLYRNYEVVITGGFPPEGWQHVGTFMLDDGDFVGHVFGEDA